MNTNRGIKSTVKSLWFFLGFGELFCLIKIIQYFPVQHRDEPFLKMSAIYWDNFNLACKAIDQKSVLYYECIKASINGLVTDYWSVIGPAAEWLLIGVISFILVLILSFILLSFCDD